MKSLPSLAELATQFSSAVMHLQPPAALIEEVQDRVLLLVNHVLMQEPAATARLRRQQNRTLHIGWQQLQLSCRITPAGLLERTQAHSAPDLSLVLSQTSPWAIAQTLARGEKPALQVQGDVMLAADINWLVDHVRWDIEEDLSRFIGDAMAHQTVAFAKRALVSLKAFLPANSGNKQADDASSAAVHTA